MTWRSLLLVGTLALATGACASSQGAAPAGEPRIASEQDIERQLGKRVRIVGQATNTEYGPSVADAGVLVYLDDYRPFPGSVVGKRVEAVGVIARDDRSGGFVRVANGKEMVFLRRASYLLLDPAPGAETTGIMANE